MALSIVWGGLFLLSVFYGTVTGNLPALGTAALAGAGDAVQLCLAVLGATCFWCGLMEVLERAGALAALCRLLSPLLGRLFPSMRRDKKLAGALSANVAANFLGLGNAATPSGLEAVRLMDDGSGRATHEMCRLIVMNTASIQLIPATVAALRASMGYETPFDILPAVWLTSLCSVSAGLAAAWILGRASR